jgi:hypothetical protein
MARPPFYRALRPEDYDGAPDWALKMFENLNQSLGQTKDALARGLTRNENMQAGSRTAIPFTSAASGTTTVRVKTDLGFTPQHATVSGLRKRNGQAITAVWSATAVPTSTTGSFDVTFQGLDASTDYFFNVLFE